MNPTCGTMLTMTLSKFQSIKYDGWYLSNHSLFMLQRIDEENISMPQKSELLVVAVYDPNGEHISCHSTEQSANITADE